MDKLTSFLLNHKKAVLVFFGIIVVCSVMMIPLVGINYDLAKYLPEDCQSNRGIGVLNQQFSYSGTALVMVDNVELNQAAEIKRQLTEIEGISGVMWLDDVSDLALPLAYQDQDVVKDYYQDGHALYTVTFDEDDYSLVTGKALEEIRAILADYKVHISGSAEESLVVRGTLSGEMGNIMIWVVPICVLILLLISQSWLEPLLYLAVIGVAVVINMGTNIIFHQVSFITFSMAAVIQLAVSMDYSIFLSHRYDEERAKGLTVRQSIMTACKASFAAVSSSAMTTICGFSALIFMQYGIGADIGLVLAKGVFLSFVCVMLLLPVLLVLFAGLIERTRHRSFIHFSPAFCKIVVKLRWVLLAAGVLLVIPAYLGQLNVDFLYGDSSGTGSGDQMSREKEAIEDVFGISAQMVLLMPNGDIVAEQELVADLEQTPGVKSVQAVVNLADPAIPRELLPTALLDNFVGSEYGRIIVNVTTVTENPAMFTVVEKIRAAAAAYYGDRYYLVGKAASIADIRDSVQVDIRETNIISMVAVGVIILLVFRSLLLPVLLVAVIQSAIYINMAVPFFLGQPLVFIGYLIVGSLQLGATIDYAILMASRYIEARAVLPKKEAAAEAIGRSGISVLTSGLILTTAGLAEAYLSALPSISSIGMLIGRGALLSACMVLVILPALLIIFDRPLQILTLKTNFYRQDHRRGGTKNEKN